MNLCKYTLGAVFAVAMLSLGINAVAVGNIETSVVSTVDASRQEAMSAYSADHVDTCSHGNDNCRGGDGGNGGNGGDACSGTTINVSGNNNCHGGDAGKGGDGGDGGKDGADGNDGNSTEKE